jgi:hypothetical protein
MLWIRVTITDIDLHGDSRFVVVVDGNVDTASDGSRDPVTFDLRGDVGRVKMSSTVNSPAEPRPIPDSFAFSCDLNRGDRVSLRDGGLARGASKAWTSIGVLLLDGTRMLSERLRVTMGAGSIDTGIAARTREWCDGRLMVVQECNKQCCGKRAMRRGVSEICNEQVAKGAPRHTEAGD